MGAKVDLVGFVPAGGWGGGRSGGGLGDWDSLRGAGIRVWGEGGHPWALTFH